jgi:hypothetical protein
MGNGSSMSRENRKKQLKRRIVPERRSYGPYAEEDSREVVYRAHKKVVNRRLKILFIILFLLAVAAFVLLRYDRYHSYTDYGVIWEKSLTGEAQEAAVKGEGSFCGYLDFADGVLKYTKDGASYLDAKGNVVWVLSYEMKSPIVAVNGEFAAIADQQGNSIYICNTSGCEGQATTLLPILRVSVSAKGVTAALEEDSKASYIYLYKRDGSSLDIYVKSILSGDGYPIDISLSPSGTQMITSYMYLEQGMIKNKVVFYNFGLGKNDPRRVVGGFQPQELADAMAGRVRFLDDSHAVIFTDKGLQFFSTRVETSPESVAQVLLDENVRSITYSEDYVGVITDSEDGENPYRLRIYRPDGSQVFEKTLNYQYTGFDIDESLVLLYNDSSCVAYNMAGTEKFKGSFDFTVSKVSAGRFPSTLLVMGPQMITEIKLQ